jgi:hypothetical protein
LEYFDDGGAVLLVSDREADEGAAVGIDHELEVESECLAVEMHVDGGAVADPLCAREEGPEGVAEGQFVRGPPLPSLWGALAVLLEDGGDLGAAEGDAEVEADVFAECAEVPVPVSPLLQEGLQVSACGSLVLDSVVFGGRRICFDGRRVQPVLEGAEGHPSLLGEALEGHVGVVAAEFDHEGPEGVAVAVALCVLLCAARMLQDERQDLLGDRGGLLRRGLWLGLRPAHRALQAGQ